MQTLKYFYENVFSFRYNTIDNRSFNKDNYWQFRDYEFEPGWTLIDFGLRIGLFSSKSDAIRKLKSGAIRIGSRDELTPWRQCQKVKENFYLQPNDFVRIGMKNFGFVPRYPTFLENAIFMLENFCETVLLLRWNHPFLQFLEKFE